MLKQALITCLFILTPLLGYSANIVINPIQGFSDTTSTSPIGGNPGTTLGAQRLNTFQKAAEILESYLAINIDIIVDAEFSPLSCNANSAILGSAGATSGHINFTNAPLANTIYPVALANNLSNTDMNDNSAEISATFNSAIDNNDNCLNGVNWYYGYDDPALAAAQYVNDSSFLSVVLHELLHGLGVSSWVLQNGALNSDLMDAFSANLYDHSTNKSWLNMNDSERQTSMSNSNNLVWAGAEVNNSAAALALTDGINSARVEMYAPNPYEKGSSVSHFSNDASPNEIMEPRYTDFLITPGMATELLKDMGWTLPSANSAPTFDLESAYSSLYSSLLSIDITARDADNDTLVYSLISADNSQISASLEGSTLSIRGTNNYLGHSTLSVSVSDGQETVTQQIEIIILEDFSLSASNLDLSDGQETSIALETFSFSLAGGNNNHDVSILFNGQALAPNLLSESNGNYQLAMPTSGAFAGYYQVNVSDSSGETARFTLKRPLRLATNIDQLIPSSDQQQLYIEGAPAGSIIDVYVTPSNNGLTLRQNNQIINQVESPDNSSQFNRASIQLKVDQITSISLSTLSADAVNLPLASHSIELIPLKSISLNITDSALNPITADILINDNRFTPWGLNQQQESDNSGKAIFDVPADRETHFTISAQNYQLKNKTAATAATQLDIELILQENPLSVSGKITTTTLDFINEIPSVYLLATDGSMAQAAITNILSTSVNYSVIVNKFNFNAERLSITHSDIEQEIDLVTSDSDSIINIQLNQLPKADTDSGTGNSFLLLPIALLLLRQRKRKTFS